MRCVSGDYLTDSRPAVDPPCINQVDVRLVLEYLGLEQVRVDDRVSRQEDFPEARRESGGRGFVAAEDPADGGGVSAEEVVDGLVVGQLGDGRQEAVGVAGEEDEVVGVASDCRELRGGHVLERVGDTGVLRDAGVAEVDLSFVFVGEARVLDDRAELDRVVDQRLVDRVQADALRVGAALDVRDAGRHPHGLVIADEPTLGVVAKRGLAGAGKAE